MLQIIGDHAHQADADRHRRIPTGVNDPIEVRFVEGSHVLQRLFVDILGVPEKERTSATTCATHRDGAHTRYRRCRAVAESLEPAVSPPRLFPPFKIRNVVILYAGQMPYKPGDGIGLSIRRKAGSCERDRSPRGAQHRGSSQMRPSGGRCSSSVPPRIGESPSYRFVSEPSHACRAIVRG